MSRTAFHIAPGKLGEYLDQLSKSTLVDLVADYLIRDSGCDESDDAKLIMAAHVAIEPVLKLRAKEGSVERFPKTPKKWAESETKRMRRNAKSFGDPDGSWERGAVGYEAIGKRLRK